jgi:hypothetical protein
MSPAPLLEVRGLTVQANGRVLVDRVGFTVE